MSNIKLLIDGDVLVYRSGFACQKRDKPVEPIEHALYLIKKAIKDMSTRFNTYNTKVFLTSDDRSNFRFKRAITKVYKGNRDKTVNPNAAGRPEHYSAIRKYLIKYYNTEVVQNIEADDALGIAQCSATSNNTIICSIDKDLDMIPGMHYNFVKDVEYNIEDPGTLTLSEDRKKLHGGGLIWFYSQMLLGDVSDNIPGLKGYGPVKVYDILHECTTELNMWNEVQKAYNIALEEEHSEEEIINRLYEVADLLWIWRKENDCKSAELRGFL